MKKIIKLLAISFAALILLVITDTANAAFNTNVAGQDCVPAVGIARAGQPMQAGCAAYSSQEYASTVGQSFDVRLYYRNTGTTDATNVNLGMVASSSTGAFNAFLNSSAGGVSGIANLTLPSNAYLEFNGAKVYQRQGGMTPVLVKEVTTLAELSNFSIPTVPSYTKCPQTNSFCYQGVFVATFTVKQDQPQVCTDPGALNFGGPLPCNYYQPPQICNDINALNYGGPLPCVPRPAQQQCVVSLYASPTVITSGQPTTLSWTSSNCNTVTIYPNIGSVSSNIAGSRIDYPVNSTNYTITGYGINTATANAIVTVGQATKPICSDGIDNDGDGLVDAADPGCFDGNVYNPTKMSEYNAPTPTNVGPTASSLSATGVTSDTCKLNSIVRVNSASPTSAYFKYGTSSSNLIYTTKQEAISSTTGNYQFADFIQSLAPNTTYYYRVVATNSFGTKEGELRSCTTRSNTVVVNTQGSSTTNTVVRPIVNNSANDRIVANSAPSLLFLRIDDRREDLTCSDVVDYQVVYKNVSNVTLERAILEVQLPAGLRYVKSSGGGTFSAMTNTVTFNIGTVLPNQEDAKFIQADVDCGLVDSDMLVANASMSYTNPTTTAQEEAVAYDLDRFLSASDALNGRTSLTGAAIFGSGFLPDSLLGWLIMILVILGLAYLVRLFLVPTVSKKPNTNINNNDYTNGNTNSHSNGNTNH